MAKKTYSLECTSAFMSAGKMITPGMTVEGVPESDAKALIRRGKAMPLKGEPTEADADEAPALEDLSVDELKATAEEYGIVGSAKMKKADLIAAIHAAEAE